MAVKRETGAKKEVASRAARGGKTAPSGDEPEVEDTVSESPSPPRRAERTKEVEPSSLESIVMGLSALRVQIGKYLAEIEEKASAESTALSEVRRAVEEEKARLKELYSIEAAADTLEDLQARQAEAKKTFEEETAAERRSFEEEMAEAREAWEKEQAQHDAAIKERDLSDKKARTREEEDYQYTTKTQRQREKDAFEREMAETRREFEESSRAKEAELEGREKTVAVQEAELKDLRAKVESFPKQLDKEIRAAEERAVRATEERLKLERMMLEKDVEREREVSKLMVAGLQTKSKEQEARIRELEKDLKDTLASSQSVAARAIEGITGFRHQAQPEPREKPPESK